MCSLISQGVWRIYGSRIMSQSKWNHISTRKMDPGVLPILKPTQSFWCIVLKKNNENTKSNTVEYNIISAMEIHFKVTIYLRVCSSLNVLMLVFLGKEWRVIYQKFVVLQAKHFCTPFGVIFTWPVTTLVVSHLQHTTCQLLQHIIEDDIPTIYRSIWFTSIFILVIVTKRLIQNVLNDE